MGIYRTDTAPTLDLLGLDDEAFVDPMILLATWRAHQQCPIPLDRSCVRYEERMHAHFVAFEAMLAILAPQLVVDLDHAIWGPHHNAARRLCDYLEIDATALALTELPLDLIYAIATTPYVMLPFGKRSLCLDTLVLKQKWYRRTHMAKPST